MTRIDSLIGITDIFLKNNRVTMHSYWLDSLTDLSAYSYGANCWSVVFRKKTTLPPCLPQEWCTLYQARGCLSKSRSSESFCRQMQNDLHLHNLPWKHASGRLPWWYFSSTGWACLSSWSRMNTHTRCFFHKKTIFFAWVSTF